MWWAVAGSIGLHVVLGSLLWPHLPQRVTPTTTSTVLIQATLIPETVRPLATATLPPSQPVATPPKPTADVGTTTELPPQLTADVPPVFDPAGYLPIDAVDQPAAPRDDWFIDTDVLPRGYTLRLVLQLWISAGGNIDRWEFYGEPDNEVLARKALARLAQTPIQPALLNQVAVPSFRRLEMVVSRD